VNGLKTVLAVLSAAVALGVVAGPAFADSASISFTDASGNVDPVAGVGRTFTLSGNAGAPKYVYVLDRAAGGAPCAPSPSSDSGTTEYGNSFSGDQFYDKAVNGNFTLKKTGTWRTPGTYMFCIWIANNDSESTTPITQNVTFRAPSGTIAATVAPLFPRPNQSATLTVTGSSEATKDVYATIRRAGGAPCATSYEADSGSGIISDTSVNGAFNVQKTLSEPAGNYLICLWLADSASDGSPVAGPQPITYSVVAPPKPCVVPYVRNLRLSGAKRKLSRSHCTTGRIVYKRSGLRRGRVVKTSPRYGRHLANGAAVRVVLSRGH
jgi:hypothetical protein